MEFDFHLISSKNFGLGKPLKRITKKVGRTQNVMTGTRLLSTIIHMKEIFRMNSIHLIISIMAGVSLGAFLFAGVKERSLLSFNTCDSHCVSTSEALGIFLTQRI